MATQRLSPLFVLILSGLWFGVVDPQFPLYTANQNQYFLHGLAAANVGLLKEDWLASTADPTPVFSGLVRLTQSYLDSWVFYVYYIVLLAIFAYSLLSIAQSVAATPTAGYTTVVNAALLALLGTPIVADLSHRIFGFDVGGELLSGVARQGTIVPLLQPSTFGVLLVLSVSLFIRGRALPAVLAACFAATVHPTYLLPPAVLVISYMLAMLRDKEPLTALAMGAFALVLVFPIGLYVWQSFRPTDPAVTREAHTLLVNFRIPWHALPGKWVGPLAFAKLALVGAALCLAGVLHRTRLLVVLGIASLAAVSLTIIQVVSNNARLAVLLPWRLSVVLVPICSFLLLSSGLRVVLERIARVFPRITSIATTASLLVLAILVSAGVVEMGRRFRAPDALARAAGGDLVRSVRETRATRQVYLVPIEFEEFRLATGVPIFSEFNSIPYKDVEFLEWYKRVRMAEAFYSATEEARCDRLVAIISNYRITHSIVPAETPSMDTCPGWRLFFRDKRFSVYERS